MGRCGIFPWAGARACPAQRWRQPPVRRRATVAQRLAAAGAGVAGVAAARVVQQAHRVAEDVEVARPVLVEPVVLLVVSIFVRVARQYPRSALGAAAARERQSLARRVGRLCRGEHMRAVLIKIRMLLYSIVYVSFLGEP